MQLVADTHTVVFYLTAPDRLISVDTMTDFGVVPKQALPDPFDRFILATAVELGLPLVTADAKITETGVAPVIW